MRQDKFSLWIRYTFQTLSKTFDISRANAIESEMFTALTVLLATTDRMLVIVMSDLSVIEIT